jgi:hypothetical protein
MFAAVFATVLNGGGPQSLGSFAPHACAQNGPALTGPAPKLVPVAAAASEPAREPPPIASPDELRRLIESMAMKHIPDKYENTKQWGQTKPILSRLKVSLDGLRVDSERVTREANHGTWKRYRIDLSPDPDALQLRVERAEQTADNKLRVELDCRAKLVVSGRVAQWERGLLLMSVGGEADAVVRLWASCEVGVELDPRRLPPDIVVRPVVTQAKLELADLRLRRFGVLNGPIAKQLGEGLEEIVQVRLADENRDLAAKLNRQIEKQQDRLRFSPQQWFQKKWDAIRPVTRSAGESR